MRKKFEKILSRISETFSEDTTSLPTHFTILAAEHHAIYLVIQHIPTTSQKPQRLVLISDSISAFQTLKT